jgi:hypothetical protein
MHKQLADLQAQRLQLLATAAKNPSPKLTAQITDNLGKLTKQQGAVEAANREFAAYEKPAAPAGAAGTQQTNTAPAKTPAGGPAAATSLASAPANSPAAIPAGGANPTGGGAPVAAAPAATLPQATADLQKLQAERNAAQRRGDKAAVKDLAGRIGSLDLQIKEIKQTPAGKGAAAGSSTANANPAAGKTDGKVDKIETKIEAPPAHPNPDVTIHKADVGPKPGTEVKQPQHTELPKDVAKPVIQPKDIAKPQQPRGVTSTATAAKPPTPAPVKPVVPVIKKVCPINPVTHAPSASC